jgi:hypothetical protein
MRQPSDVGLLVLSLVLSVSSAVFAAPASTKKIQAKFHVANVDVPTTSSIQIGYSDVAPEDQSAIANAVTPLSSWLILVDDKLSTVLVQTASVRSTGIIVLTLTAPLGTDTVLNHHISVLFTGDPSTGVQPQMVEVKQPRPQELFHTRWFLPKFDLTTDKKNANLDVSGSLQTAVGSEPQYMWNVLAKYPVEYQGSIYIFKAGPQFTGIASQETNADPDSQIASAKTEFDFPKTRVFGKNLPINLLFNPIDYEFERKPKQEAVLSNGKATLHSYQQKNTNLIVSGEAQFVESWWPVNVNINFGTELGSAVSRSITNMTPKSGYSDSPLRAVAGSDVYFDLTKVGKYRAGKYPFVSVDGHYTVRSLFHPEPFKQAGVNDGNEFNSTKARHYIAVNLARTIVKGANLTVQYRYGSLPPTYSFVDNQVTIGFEVVLGK